MISRIGPFFTSVSLFFHRMGTVIFISAMVGLITSEVFLRYVFKAPLLWGKDLNGLLLLIVFFASLTYCWDARRHIRMEILYMRFKGRTKAFADIIAALMGMIFFGMLGMKGIEVIPYMYATNETPEFLPVPLWPFSAFMAVCSFLLCTQLLISLLNALSKILSTEDR